MEHLNFVLERYLPERRLFLRSEAGTRYVRLRPISQAVVLTVAAGYMTFSLVATAMLFYGLIGSADLREAALREQTYFETRLNEMAEQRDTALTEAQAAHLRYGEAMDRVAVMQGLVLDGEQRIMELEQGIDALQASFGAVMGERDAALARLAELESGDANAELTRVSQQLSETEQTLDFLMGALGQTADEREAMRALADSASQQTEFLAMENRLIQDRNNRIFTTLETAVSTSMEPLEALFRNAGFEPQQIIEQVRSGYQSQSASLMPASISTSGTMDPQSDEMRANALLSTLADIDLYRIAAERTPYAMPIFGRMRLSSDFGSRSDPFGRGRRLHNGVDWAGLPLDTPVYAPGDGRVTFAGHRGSWGNLVIIEYDFGMETYFAHLNSINVTAGQRVSRGDRIAGIGTSGRSTGVHLHYEVRVNGSQINPLTYIRAAQNVF